MCRLRNNSQYCPDLKSCQRGMLFCKLFLGHDTAYFYLSPDHDPFKMPESCHKRFSYFGHCCCILPPAHPWFCQHRRQRLCNKQSTCPVGVHSKKHKMGVYGLWCWILASPDLVVVDGRCPNFRRQTLWLSSYEFIASHCQHPSAVFFPAKSHR